MFGQLENYLWPGLFVAPKWLKQGYFVYQPSLKAELLIAIANHKGKREFVELFFCKKNTS